jgi:hypothetical protein
MKRDFNDDISKWDVSNVTNMTNMFREASFNGDISGWNVSHAEDVLMVNVNVIKEKVLSFYY